MIRSVLITLRLAIYSLLLHKLAHGPGRGRDLDRHHGRDLAGRDGARRQLPGPEADRGSGRPQHHRPQRETVRPGFGVLRRRPLVLPGIRPAPRRFPPDRHQCAEGRRSSKRSRSAKCGRSCAATIAPSKDASWAVRRSTVSLEQLAHGTRPVSGGPRRRTARKRLRAGRHDGREAVPAGEPDRQEHPDRSRFLRGDRADGPARSHGGHRRQPGLAGLQPGRVHPAANAPLADRRHGVYQPFGQPRRRGRPTEPDHADDRRQGSGVRNGRDHPHVAGQVPSRSRTSASSCPRNCCGRPN